MYLKRIIYDQLLDWKNDTSHSTGSKRGENRSEKHTLSINSQMKISGIKSNINLFEQSGQQFMECYKQATSWTPGTKTPRTPSS